MKANSNLPPGCNSPDGGINYALEDAVDALLQKPVDAEDLAALSTFVEPLQAVIAKAYRQGFNDGKAEAMQVFIDNLGTES